jgi:hypothetical protein
MKKENGDEAGKRRDEAESQEVFVFWKRMRLFRTELLVIRTLTNKLTPRQHCKRRM